MRRRKDPMTVRETLSAALAAAVAGLAKAHGFRKKALAFRRTHGQTTQAISFQLSGGTPPGKALSTSTSGSHSTR